MDLPISTIIAYISRTYSSKHSSVHYIGAGVPFVEASIYFQVYLGFPGGIVVKNLPANRRPKRRGFDPWVGKIPWSRKWQPTPIFLPGIFQRSLVGYSPWGHKGSDTTEQAAHHFIKLVFKDLGAVTQR